MNRSVFLALAAVAMAFSTSDAFAGGSNSQYVRIKNISAAPVTVSAANGVLKSTSATRILSQNAVTQFVLKKGAGQFGVMSAGGTGYSVLEYNFPKSTYVYLQAQDVDGKVTPRFAPPGTRF